MSGGGGSGSDDMQVSGAEAAYSTEKGIAHTQILEFHKHLLVQVVAVMVK